MNTKTYSFHSNNLYKEILLNQFVSQFNKLTIKYQEDVEMDQGQDNLYDDPMTLEEDHEQYNLDQKDNMICE